MRQSPCPGFNDLHLTTRKRKERVSFWKYRKERCAPTGGHNGHLPFLKQILKRNMGLSWRYLIRLLLLSVVVLPTSQHEGKSPGMRWELEFRTFKFDYSLARYLCSANIPSVQFTLVIRYVHPNSHIGETELKLKRSNIRCSSMVIFFVGGNRQNHVTISNSREKACHEESRLQLFLEVRGIKKSQLPTLRYQGSLHSIQTDTDWTDLSLRENSMGSSLQFKWRVRCTELENHAVDYNGKKVWSEQKSIIHNEHHGKRLVRASGLNESADTDLQRDAAKVMDNFTAVNSPSEVTTGTPQITTIVKTVNIGNLAKLLSPEIETSTGNSASGEPPDSFITGVSEVIGLTNAISPDVSKSSKSQWSFTTKDFSALFEEYMERTKHPIGDNLALSERSQISEGLLSDVTLPSGITKQDNEFLPIKMGSNGLNAPAAGDIHIPNLDLISNKTNVDMRSVLDNTTSVLLEEMQFDNSSIGLDGNSTDPHFNSPNITDTEYLSNGSVVVSNSTEQQSSISPTTKVSTGTNYSLSTRIKVTSPVPVSIKTAFAEEIVTKHSEVDGTSKKDVIFTTARQDPTPMPDGPSNEVYMGKTVVSPAAGILKDDDESTPLEEGTNEATLWPIVMGLVIGIPTIIVLSIAIAVVQRKHLPGTFSSPGYFERRPPQIHFVQTRPSRRTCDLGHMSPSFEV